MKQAFCYNISCVNETKLKLRHDIIRVILSDLTKRLKSHRLILMTLAD